MLSFRIDLFSEEPTGFHKSCIPCKQWLKVLSVCIHHNWLECRVGQDSLSHTCTNVRICSPVLHYDVNFTWNILVTKYVLFTLLLGVISRLWSAFLAFPGPLAVSGRLSPIHKTCIFFLCFYLTIMKKKMSK